MSTQPPSAAAVERVVAAERLVAALQLAKRGARDADIRLAIADTLLAIAGGEARRMAGDHRAEGRNSGHRPPIGRTSYRRRDRSVR